MQIQSNDVDVAASDSPVTGLARHVGSLTVALCRVSLSPS